MALFSHPSNFLIERHPLVDLVSSLRDIDEGFQTLIPTAGDWNTKLNVDDKKYKLNIDCHHFKPEERNIKLQDSKLVIHGKHEEKQDEHGYIKREFTRSYVMPDGCDLDALKSSLSKNGFLTIECPRNVLPQPDNVKTIPIERMK